jgi:hypothetical protein
MRIHDTGSDNYLVELMQSPLAVVERARGALSITHPVSSVELFGGRAKIWFYENRAALDADMVELAALTYENAAQVVEVDNDGTCVDVTP